MGTNTDPYQRAEGKYHLTQGIVRVLTERANPFSILTKSTLVLRDLELLAEAARVAQVRVDLSIATLDEDVWRRTEPGAPHPRRRVEAVAKLNAAGVASGVLLGAVLPGVSDGEEQLREVVDACVEAGAVSVGVVPLHLRPGVKEHFLAAAEQQLPDQARDLARRYRGRAYLPKAEVEDLSARVRRLVAEARRRHGPPPLRSRGGFRLVERAVPRSPPPSGERAPGVQLGLGL